MQATIRNVLCSVAFVSVYLSWNLAHGNYNRHYQSYEPAWNYEAYLTVESAQSNLHVDVYPRQQSIREGHEVVIHCRAHGHPTPRIRWTRLGGRLPVGATDTNGQLKIPQVRQSDSGSYVCTATSDGKRQEVVAEIRVQPYGPIRAQTGPRTCSAGEKTCSSGECVKLEFVCDGRRDCWDGSDEVNCSPSNRCEPNEFRCDNGRCVQKMWICDGDDDCGDSSDEKNCEPKKPGDICKSTEYQCQTQEQCIPQAFQCDKQNDCFDGSDEIGCAKPTVVEPPVEKLSVPLGHTITMTCRAVGVPIPYINWRLNWGLVCPPPRCTQTSVDGFGTLTITDARDRDSGAYTCEAINIRGRVLGVPDCIVTVLHVKTECNRAGSTAVTAGPQGQCTCKLHVTGRACDRCKPETFWLNQANPHGCISCFCSGVTRVCTSTTWQRTKHRLFFNEGNTQGVTLCNFAEDPRSILTNPRLEFRPRGMITHNERHGETLFWRLPTSMLGNKITAYGGTLSVKFMYTGVGPMKSDPLIVLKGNDIVLVHRRIEQQQSPKYDPNYVHTIEFDMYETHWEREDGYPATREHLLMTLADLSSFLVRATHVTEQESSSLGEVVMEIAVNRDTQQVRAFAVEECECPPGYIGLSCEDCAPGYERSGGGLYLGTCIETAREPPADVTQQCDRIGSVSPEPDPRTGRCQCKPYVTGARCETKLDRVQVIIAKPKDVRVSEGESATFRCYVEGWNGAYRPIWTRSGGRSLAQNSQVTDGVLTISQVKLEDAGSYVCSVSTPWDRPSDTANLIVDRSGVAPVVSIDPSSQTVEQGQSAQFVCTATGEPRPVITWSFGEPGPPLRRDIRQEHGKLIIDSCRTDDQGDYYCTASNIVETVSRKAVLSVVSTAAPTVRIEPKDRWEGGEGESFTFQAVVTGNPPPVILWSRENGHPFSQNVQDTGDGYLQISSAALSDSGRYLVTAENIVGRAEAVATVVIVPSIQIQITSKPSMDKHQRIIRVGAGDPMEIECRATGDPGPTVEWFRDRGPSRGDVPEGFTPAVISRFFVRHPEVSAFNAGEYRCRASNNQSSAEETVVVEVIPASRRPVLILGGPNKYFPSGSVVELQCIAPGPMDDTLFWSRLNGPMPTAGASELPNGILRIVNFKAKWEGEYECQSRKSSGETINSAKVQIGLIGSGDPLIEVEGALVRAVTEADSTSLTCKVPGDRNAKISWYHVNQRGETSEKDSSGGTLEITQADANKDSGLYKCVAEDQDGNELGVHTVALIVSYRSGNFVDQAGELGKDVQIVCPVFYVPGIDISFKKLEGDIPSKAVQDRNRLEIRNFALSDTGRYECKADLVGNVDAFGYISVFSEDVGGLISVFIETSDEYVKLGENVTFTCRVTGDQSATLTWQRKSGKAIPSNAKIVGTSSGTGNSLALTNVREDNSDVYICAASTRNGLLTANVILDIRSKKRRHLMRDSASRHREPGNENRPRNRHRKPPINERLRHSQDSKDGQFRVRYGKWFSTAK